MKNKICTSLEQSKKLIELEEWKIIDDFPNYSISNTGKVRKNATGKLLSLRHNHHGYLMCWLYNNNHKKGLQVHRLVDAAFIRKPLVNEVIDHINGVRDDNRVCNLRWCTVQENNAFPLAIDNKQPYKKPCSQYTLDVEWIADFESMLDAQNKTNVSTAAISMCCNNRMKQAGGYQWRVKDDTKTIPPISKVGTVVLCYSLDGNLVKEYPSCISASKELGVGISTLNVHIGNEKPYKGYLWKYKYDRKRL